VIALFLGGMSAHAMSTQPKSSESLNYSTIGAPMNQHDNSSSMNQSIKPCNNINHSNVGLNDDSAADLDKYKVAEMKDGGQAS